HTVIFQFVFIIIDGSEFVFFFFFSSRRRHTRFSRDWSSDVCSSDLALSGFLSENARYEGFDVVEKGVNWCKKGIGKDFPNFNFRSEERRVGKECRCWWKQDYYKKK